MTSDRSQVQATAEEIRRAILKRHGFQRETDVPGATVSGALEEAAGHARVSAHWGITSNIPILGKAFVLAMRATRIALRWYINPIVQQQNRFNDAAVRALYELQAENERLATEVDRLKQGSGPQ